MAIHTPGHHVHAATHARMRVTIFTRDGFTCQDCGWKPPTVPEPYVGTSLAQTYRDDRGRTRLRMLELDHIVPVKHGGLFVASNLQTLCNSCNARKGARMPVSA